MKRGQRLPHNRVAQSGEPAFLIGRQRLEIPADRLDEHQFRQTRQHVFSARVLTAGLLRRDIQKRAQPSGSRAGIARRQMNHARQRDEQRIVRTFVAAHERADDARTILAAAAELVDVRQRRRCARERGHVGLRAHPGRARQDVRIALRKHDQIAFVQSHRLVADRVSPARAARDHVVLDDALRARHHLVRDRGRWRRLEHPGRAELEVEVERAGQMDGAEHVGEHVGLHAPSSRTRGHVRRTIEQVEANCRRTARQIGRAPWL